MRESSGWLQFIGLVPRVRPCVCFLLTFGFGVISAQFAIAQSIPDAETSLPTEVTAVTAVLNATVNPRGSDTLVYFEYGNSTNYSSTTPLMSIGRGNGFVPVSATVARLLPLTECHFRIAATNEAGVTYGPDVAFTTATSFALASVNLPALRNGSAAWGDCDNDGRLDILLAGNDSAGTGSITVYRNIGDGQFTNSATITPIQGVPTAKWCDYDNDGLLDIIVYQGAWISLYHNNSDGTFASPVSLWAMGYKAAASAWGDYNNDGRQDLLVFGLLGDFPNTCVLFQNLGRGNFGSYNSTVRGVKSGAAAWGDYDNDGKLDILIAGIFGVSLPVRGCQIYHNPGNDRFTNINANLPPLANCSVAWGDYDQDGKLDLLLAGATNAGGTAVTMVYRNLGGGAFTNINAALPGVNDCSVAWGDFDADGRPDILASGSKRTIVCRNNRDGSFAEILTPIPGTFGSAAWGDFNGDGRLDILACGSNVIGEAVCQVFQNVNTPSNMSPSEPRGLSAQLKTNGATLSWEAASDSESGWDGLSYNLRVGTTPGGGEVMSAPSGANGVLTLPSLGNVDEVTNRTVNGLILGTRYYWSVQAVDAGFSGSAFAAEQSFLFAFVPQVLVYYPNVRDQTAVISPIVTANGGATTVTVAWGLTKDLDSSTPPQVLPETASKASLFFPLTNLTPVTTYYFQIIASNVVGISASPIYDFKTYDVPVVVTQWVSGIESGAVTLNAKINPNGGAGSCWFEYGVDNNYGYVTATNFLDYSWSPLPVTVPVRGLQGGLTYHFRVVATNFIGPSFSADSTFLTTSEPTTLTYPASDIALTSARLNGSVNANGFETGRYFDYGLTTNYGNRTPWISVGSSSNWVPVTAPIADLLPGATYHYRLVGTNMHGGGHGDDLTVVAAPPFTAWTNQFPGLLYSAAAFADFDNDGRLDLVVSGQIDSNLTTRIYRNQGGGQLVDMNADLIGLRFSSVAWGDYDNDGWIDLLICGEDTNHSVLTKLYRNNRGATFSEVNAGLPGVRLCCLWADFDNDGRLDVLLVGEDIKYAPMTSIFRNEGNGAFSRYDTGLTPMSFGAAAVSDFNRDGRLDIAVLGRNANTSLTRLYRNDGDGRFTDMQAGLSGVIFGSLAWGDFDNDSYPDLAVTGSAPGYLTRLYHNNRGQSFTPVNSAMVDVYRSSIAWGDYDNDGFSDLLVAGHDPSNKEVTRIYRNDHGTNFISIEAGLPQVWLGAVAWADVDNDGRLDILVSGSSQNTNSTAIHQNVGPFEPNTPPIPPTSPSANVFSNGVRLAWIPASDEQTPTNGLTYNLRVGTTPGGSDIVSPGSEPLGFRQLAREGNASYETSWPLTNLAAGSYFWSVQAIDTGFAGSAFSDESVFVIGPVRIVDAFLSTNNTFRLRFCGNCSSTYEVLFSHDLLTWVSRGLVTNGSSNQFEYCSPASESSGAGFYRLQVHD